MQPLNYIHDSAKAESNLRKHGVSFAEAETVFLDSLASTVMDDQHSIDEQRFVTVGTSAQGRLVFVVYTENESAVRIIGARLATATERHQYEELG